MSKHRTSIEYGSSVPAPGQVGFLVEEDDTRPGANPRFHIEPEPLRDAAGAPTLDGTVNVHRLRTHGGGGYRLAACGVVIVVRLFGEPDEGMSEEELVKVGSEARGRALVETLEGDELRAALEELGFPELAPE